MSEYDHLLDSEEPDGGSEPLPPLRAEPLELPPPEPYAEPDDDSEEVPPEPPDVRAKDDARAQRMIAKMRAEAWYEGKLPPDIEEVWGKGIRDASGLPAEHTARSLIGAWGLDRFRQSALHHVALTERESEARMKPIRAAYVKAVKEKEKKK